MNAVTTPISLIANSGIQFYDIPLSLGDTTSAFKLRFEYAELDDSANDRVYLAVPYALENGQYISRIDINADAFRADGSVDEAKIRPENMVRLREDQFVSIQGRDALNLLEGTWLPVPYFRAEHNNARALKQGPQSWARMYLGRVGTQQQLAGSTVTHKLVLAFDTHCDDEDDPVVNAQNYLVPDSRDPKGGQTQFVCASHEDTNGFWLSQRWVNDWLEGELIKRKASLPRQFTEDTNYYLLHIGLYMTLLKVLEQVGAFPTVSLQDGGLMKPIDVNLVLDVGNSRTCGLVLESSSRERDAELALTDARRLRIRELWNPTRSSNQPFEMKLAFMEARFGGDGGLRDDRLFKWPSLVRVGPEATRYGVIFGEGQPINGQYEMTFSSPKRYLWDDKRREKPWGYYAERTETTQRPATALPLAERFTTEGLLVSKANRQAVERGESPYTFTPASNPMFSRKSLMTFALTEIILQTLSYVNSYEYRRDLGEAGVPRRLRRIVLTCPTAMPKVERVRLRECASDALEALREYYGAPFSLLPADLEILPAYDIVSENDPEHKIPKDLRDLKENGIGQRKTAWGYDEATCSQLVFLYNEIVHRFKPNNASLYFETMGRKRVGDYNPDQKSLMIASVDIGGGTTDLMIGHYEYEPGAVTCVYPSPIFWEGFNRAGDQILKRLIEECVLPPIAAEAKRLGCQRAGQVLYSLFGPHQPADSDAKRTRKKLFANQVSAVIAQGMLDQITRQPDQSRQMAYDEFFLNHEAPIPGVLDYVNSEFRREGATGFDLQLISWNVSPQEISEKVIRNVMGGILRDLCGIIAQYGCDYVLLSGRPSTLPAVLDMFLEYLPVSPDRIVPMNRIRVATSERFWYPFSDRHEYTIKDPKTCVTVGASIALLAELGLLNGFRLDTRLLATRMTSTADYIGLLTDGATPRVNQNNVLISPDNPGPEPFFFTGGQDAFLGMRQMASESWLATPLYKIEFVNDQARQQLQTKLPVEVSVRRSSRNDKELLVPVKGANLPGTDTPALKLTLCTLTDPYGYWIDTGNFHLNLY